MGRILLSLITGYCFFITHTCLAQDLQVSDPKLELRGNFVHITYDIFDSEASDQYNVSISINDVNGNKINAASLSGDVGEMVSGGSNKLIIWDLEADQIKMNAKIFVKVYVKAIAGDLSSKNEKEYNRTGIILQSLLFPGLGLSRVSGNPHWIRGVAGYGCIAGAVIMNRKAIATYDGIAGLPDFDEKNDLYQQSLSQDKVSEILAYAAIGIWVTDLIWTIAGTSDPGAGFSFRSLVDPVSGVAMIGINYKF